MTCKVGDVIRRAGVVDNCDDVVLHVALLHNMALSHNSQHQTPQFSPSLPSLGGKLCSINGPLQYYLSR